MQVADTEKSERGFLFGAYCIVAAFGTYFCMYAFHKPFAAGTYADLEFAGMNYKILLIITQVAGYTLSKFIGIKVISEMTRNHRIAMLLGLIGISELGLVGLGVVPYPYNWVCMFLNGLSLGMIWGIVFSYLEGRHSTEALAAGLSASFIVSSGVVKAVGKYLMTDWGVPEFWMPAMTGGLFVIPLFFFAYLLSRIPTPDARDIEERTERVPMTRADRWSMLRKFWLGLLMLILAHMLLTAMRDFRDKFAVEILGAMGIGDAKHLATSELPVMLLALIPLGCIMFIRSHRAAFSIVLCTLLFGFAIAGVSTLAWQAGLLDGFAWFITVGIGLYLAYVPYHSMLFERFIALFREKGNTNYDENVTQLEHGLQSAALARAAGATPQQVISALFHDLGHLLVDEHAGEGDFLDEDLNHEEVGAEYLRPFFPPEVIVPIELHVPAKRYLCTVDDSYYNGLSESSKRSFRVQGGKMSDEEKALFEDTPHLEFACQLRRWDDGGKQGGLEVPDLEAYRDDCLASLI